MALLARSRELILDHHVTIAQGASIKGVDYHALRMFLRNHPEIETRRIGSVVLVRKEELLEKYQPLQQV